MILKYIFILSFYCYIATDGSPPPPKATSENPSNTWQDSSSPDSTTERSIGLAQSGGDKGYVRLRSSGPTVRGANVTLSATFVDGYPGVELKFVFRNFEEREIVGILSSEAVVNHTIKLSKYRYESGIAEFEVAVYGRNIFDPNIFRFLSSDVIKVSVTDLLNGKLKLMQNGFDRSYGRVFPNERVSHIIELSQEEQQFLTDDNTYIVHWYIDCSLISSTGLSFDYTYENADKTYTLEALVEVAHTQYSSAPRVMGRRSDRLSGFKCAPIYSSGYTYGYYKVIVRADATGVSPPPPMAVLENPSNTWQDSSSQDSTAERSIGLVQSGGDKGYVRLRSSGPTVRGTNITLSATFLESYLGVERKFVFRNFEEQETVEILSSEAVVNHTMKLSKYRYESGIAEFEVAVYGRNIFDPNIFRFLSSDVIKVPVTDLLNGKLKLIQNGFDRSYGRVFPNELVNHIIELSQEEQQFLTDDNTYIVHWYIDCSLISSTGLSFNYTYENADKTYILEALIEVAHTEYASVHREMGRRSNRLSGFKCAPIYSSGYTYGYYKASVRADATDGSPPPPRTTSENPSSTWQDSSSPDSTTERSIDLFESGGDRGFVRLTSSGPTVRGANITLSATFVDGYPGVERKFVFRNFEEREIVGILSSEAVVNHTMKLSKYRYESGIAEFQVAVYGRNIYDPNIFRFLSSDVIKVPVTDLLNGKLKLIQNGFDRSYGRVFPNERVSHIIELSQEEQQFLTDDNTYIVHWYIDCSLISSTGLSFDYTYENADKTYTLEALVEVAHTQYSSAPRVMGRRSDRLSGFKCAPIYSSGYTYGYYKVIVRADATGVSPPPPMAVLENPSNTWQDSSSQDSTAERSIGLVQSGGDKGYVRLRSSGPTVRGTNITLSATFLESYLGVERKFVFRNFEEQETVEILSSEAVVNHTMKLSKYRYESGIAEFEVAVYGRNIFDPNIFRFLSSDVIKVPVTDLLNGKLKLIQNGFDRSYGRVFPNELVNHIIELSQEEQQFLTDDNTYIVHWYIDCSLISSTGLSFNYTYENADKTYILEALIEVAHTEYASVHREMGRRSNRLSGFKCAPIYSSGYTYGYYKASVRADATDGSPPPPRATSENPSSTWQDSSSPDSTTERSIDLFESGGDRGFVRLTSSGPTVRGANITLSATFVDGYPGVERKFVFRNFEEREIVGILSSEAVVNHTMKLSKYRYKSGIAEFEVAVYGRNVFDPNIFRFLSSDVIKVPVTDLLNGKLKLIQNGFDRSYGRVFPNERVSHIIELSQEEQQFLTDDNTYIVHWYIDCSLMSSTGLSFDYTYENADKTYTLEALVEVAHTQYSSAPRVMGRRSDRLSGFKCAPIYSSGYTYGYYKVIVRADAVAVSENPSNTWQDSSSQDSTAERSIGLVQSGGDKGYVRLRSSGPTVRGANITLSATFLESYLGVERKFVLRNFEEQETVEILSSEAVVNHTMKLSKYRYESGIAEFEVAVYGGNIFDPNIFRFLSSDVIKVPVTDLLNGKLKLIQNGFDRSYGRVFPNERVSHIIELSQEEQQFLTDDNTYIVHWYIDCSLISSTGLSFDYTYENANKTYILEALVEVAHTEYASAYRVMGRRSNRLSGFKCAPIYSSGYTYGYYKASVRADATDGSPPPPKVATATIPINFARTQTLGKLEDNRAFYP